jgi:hypothetical protein
MQACMQFECPGLLQIWMVGDRHVLNIIIGVVLGEGDLGKLWNGWSVYSVCSLFWSGCGCCVYESCIFWYHTSCVLEEVTASCVNSRLALICRIPFICLSCSIQG